ncbi:MAG: histidine--tRNA ligase [Halobacteriovoraceae bacterium]|nr:histidine--tRNA ligase [Halobacteriovoraceae bacterium]|tara:strand:+ start:198524 stop:199834 length:1311 start_codon:yes stop_codon:yes gene_type:complete
MTLSKKPYKGCRDFFPKEMRERNYLFEAMKTTAESFAYEPFDGPMVEEVELYKAKSGEELINEQIYEFTDRGNRHVAIRPEMTPTVARMVAQIAKQASKPIRWYSIPNLMRYEKPQRGRLREHWQFNVDIFGAPENLGEIEVLSVVSQLLESFGATKEMFGIQLNDRKIVDYIFNEIIAVDSEISYRLYKIIDKSKKVDRQALEKMTSEVLTEKSKQDAFYEYLELDSFEKVTNYLKGHNYPRISEFEAFVSKLSNSQASEFVEYDPAIVRGLDYYTGVVFEVFDKHPDNKRAIAGGGAYANLLQIFNEPALPGIGFGMGDVTLKDFLISHDLMPKMDHAINDVFLTYLTGDGEAMAMSMAKQLRMKGLKVETHLGVMKFKKLFKTAEGKGHRNVALIGEDEVKNNTITVKNMVERKQETFDAQDIESITNFLKQG